MSFPGVFSDSADLTWAGAGKTKPAVSVPPSSALDASMDAFFGSGTVQMPLVSRLIEDGQVALAAQKAAEFLPEYFLPGIHPSSISGSKCARSYFLRAAAMSNETHSPAVLRIFDNGHDVHTRIQRYLQKHLVGTWRCENCRKYINTNQKLLLYAKAFPNFQLDPDIHQKSASLVPIHCPTICPVCAEPGPFHYAEWAVVSPEMFITGRMDGLLDVNGRIIPIEIKSMNDRNFSSLSTKGVLPHYIIQFSLYMHILGYRAGVFIIENKNNQKIFEADCVVDMKLIQPFLDRCSLSAQAFFAGRGQDALPVDLSECPDCNVRSSCTYVR